jgi:hypothetical protein
MRTKADAADRAARTEESAAKALHEHAMEARGGAPARVMTHDMANEMGHGAGMDMHAMVRDMRNRFWISLVFTVPIFIYSPMGNMFTPPAPPFGFKSAIAAKSSVSRSNLARWEAKNPCEVESVAVSSLVLISSLLSRLGRLPPFRASLMWAINILRVGGVKQPQTCR